MSVEERKKEEKWLLEEKEKSNLRKKVQLFVWI